MPPASGQAPRAAIAAASLAVSLAGGCARGDDRVVSGLARSRSPEATVRGARQVPLRRRQAKPRLPSQLDRFEAAEGAATKGSGRGRSPRSREAQASSLALQCGFATIPPRRLAAARLLLEPITARSLGALAPLLPAGLETQGAIAP